MDNDSDKILETEETLTILSKPKFGIRVLSNGTNYSSLEKLVLNIGWLNLNLNKFKKLWIIRKWKLLTIEIHHKVTIKDIEQAEFEIFKEAQLECFADEFRTLKKDMRLSKQ